MRSAARTLTVASLLAAVAAPAVASPATAGAGAPGPRVIGAVGQPTEGGNRGAYAYDTRLVPAGARIEAMSVSIGGTTATALAVRGLRPLRTYGTHLHARPCGADPAAAGDHYQRRRGATTDPDYANPRNEVWLDVRTNADGVGFAYARNPWEYGQRWPRSVVLHEHATSTDHDTPGVAGARLACVTLSRL